MNAKDLGKFLKDAYPPVAPSAEFKEKLIQRLVAQIQKERR